LALLNCGAEVIALGKNKEVLDAFIKEVTVFQYSSKTTTQHMIS